MLVGVVRCNGEIAADFRSVVPILVGVVRSTLILLRSVVVGCPHARGGGPLGTDAVSPLQFVVPMLVGVVRVQGRQLCDLRRVVPMLVGVVRL